MQNAITELEELTLNGASKSFLRETAKWTYFLSILGFIGLGLTVIFSFFAGTVFSNLPNMNEIPFDFGPVMTVTYLIIVAIYFFPIFYLYKFSVNMKKALQSKSDDDLAVAFEKLKSHYKFVGVFAIIVLSLYLLLFVIAMLGVAIGG